MSTLTNWGPRRLAEWPEVNSLLSEFMRRSPVDYPENRLNHLRPMADVIETPSDYVVKLDVPGIDPSDVNVFVTGDTLNLHGEKRQDETSEDDHCCITERSFGTFDRSITFPNHIDSKRVEATANNGVLTVKVHKAQESQPHKIQVKTR